jgi:hypothetical protein
MSSQARGLQNFISDLRNAKSKVRIHVKTQVSFLNALHGRSERGSVIGVGGISNIHE